MNSTSNKRFSIGGASGAGAAARARLPGADCEFIWFERGPQVSFAHCGLPYFVSDEIAARVSLRVPTPESLKARFNLEMRIKTKVMRADPTAGPIRMRESETGRQYEEACDPLVLSTDPLPLRPLIPGIERPNHFMVRNLTGSDRTRRLPQAELNPAFT